LTVVIIGNLIMLGYLGALGLPGTRRDVKPSRCSSAVALVVENAVPQYSTALSSMVVGGVAHWALSAVAKPAEQTA
jgi:hypothetical protein